jgi:alginate O-acetyltransferase complex protein AlgI
LEQVLLFNSLEFVLLVIVVAGLFYLPKARRFQVELLCIASSYFYSFGQPALFGLLLVSIVLNFSLAKSLHIKKNFTTLALGVSLNLFILVSFKYKVMVNDLLFSIFGFDIVPEALLQVELPIGISFYTFQGISLLVDIYRGDGKFDPSLKKTFFYISFFPQLVAGPIVKMKEFFHQIEVKRISDIDWENCFTNVVTGYFLNTGRR